MKKKKTDKNIIDKTYSWSQVKLLLNDKEIPIKPLQYKPKI